MRKIRVLVVGCGRMGRPHARAYRQHEGFELVGLVSRGDGSREKLAAELGGDVAQFGDFAAALAATRPDAVSINTYPDTHARYALASMEAGAHVFLEKPLAETVADAEAVVRAARERKRKLVVGYILHHHPAYAKLVELGRTLGKPLVMRMNLNRQSQGPEWRTQRNLMASVSPIVDCGVHYVDLMCRVTGARPLRVHAIGARLTEEIKEGMHNYGQLQIAFDDGSVGWFESGWGPMMSAAGHPIRDFIGPGGHVSLVHPRRSGAGADAAGRARPHLILYHPSRLDADGAFAEPEQALDIADEPTHQELCDREQAFFHEAIRADLDLAEHWRGAVDSLRIVLAGDESFRTGRIVEL